MGRAARANPRAQQAAAGELPRRVSQYPRLLPPMPARPPTRVRLSEHKIAPMRAFLDGGELPPERLVDA